MKRFGMIALALLVVAAALPSALAAKGNYTTPAGDLRIPKNEVTTEVKFFPYTASGKTYMEVIAVRAPDGTIRTAFNTCQVCYASGRGWYTVQGEMLVCNNCGNKFRISQLELIKGGCNPVPITKELKSEDADSILVSKDLMEEAKVLFLKWKKK
jgi:uncharacterized membrane protein